MPGVDFRNHGQTEKEFETQAACGFALVDVTNDPDSVTCKLCLNAIKKGKDFHADNINCI